MCRWCWRWLGTLSLPFGEGVQCVGTVLEPWWSKKTGGLELEMPLSSHWYSCKKQRELYHSLSSRETEAESCTKQNLTCWSGLLFQLWEAAHVPESSSVDFQLLIDLSPACPPCLAASAEVTQWAGFLPKASGPRRARAACELCLVGFSCRLSIP